MDETYVELSRNVMLPKCT